MKAYKLMQHLNFKETKASKKQVVWFLDTQVAAARWRIPGMLEINAVTCRKRIWKQLSDLYAQDRATRRRIQGLLARKTFLCRKIDLENPSHSGLSRNWSGEFIWANSEGNMPSIKTALEEKEIEDNAVTPRSRKRTKLSNDQSTKPMKFWGHSPKKQIEKPQRIPLEVPEE